MDNIRANIGITIGCEYELIVIDNTGGQYNIFQAYNRGVQLSKGDILCFCHEDLIFHTRDWGSKVIDHFRDDRLGMIGICGGNAFPACPAPWWNSTVLNQHFSNHISTWPGEVSFHDYKNPNDADRASDCIAVDGAWFCIARTLFEKVTFDEALYNGFHFYDIDISFQVIDAGYNVRVVYDVLLEHFSRGSINRDWAQSGEVFADKWKHRLPISLNKASAKTFYRYNIDALLTYAYWIRSVGYSQREVRRILKKYLKRTGIRPYWNRDAILLIFWQFFGFTVARIFVKPLKLLK